MTHAGMPPERPIPDLDTDWTEFPNDYDREMMQWREDLELHAIQLRAEFMAAFQDGQPIPLAKYEDGKIELKLNGKRFPVSKRYYGWVIKSRLLTRDDAPAYLAHVMSTRASAQASTKKS